MEQKNDLYYRRWLKVDRVLPPKDEVVNVAVKQQGSGKTTIRLGKFRPHPLPGYPKAMIVKTLPKLNDGEVVTHWRRIPEPPSD